MEIEPVLLPEATQDELIFPGADVWVETHDPGEYRRGFVTAIGSEEVSVDFSMYEEAAGEEVCSRQAVWPANEPDMYADDLAALVHLSPATILENLRAGLELGRIYSWVGPILVALNPMRPLPDLYTEAAMAACRDTPGAGLGAKTAHPFVQAELALRELQRHKRSASFVVSGESGAGKTETSRQLLNYCLWRVGGSNDSSSSSGSTEPASSSGGLSSLLLQASSVVELFGSAATLHNANSSRVGRYLVLDFAQPASSASSSSDLAVRGARLQTFLLERSRVVSVAPGERGFHVFYGLLRSPTAAASTGLGPFGRSPDEFGYLKPGLDALGGRDDADDFAQTLSALSAMGASDATRASISDLLAAVLLLGNLSFEQDDESEASHLATSSLPLVEQLTAWLGADLRETFVKRELQPGGFAFSAVIQTLNATAAARARDAVARALYSSLFAHVVELVNGALRPGGDGDGDQDGAGGEAAASASTRTIGLLDIFGFERFDVNSLEQLLINFANEKLHHHFLASVFEAEHQLYAAEAVHWPDVAIPDNGEVVHLIGEGKTGLLSLLDDQSALPNPSDEAFCTAAFQSHARSPFFSKPKQRKRKLAAGQSKAKEPPPQKQGEFVVRHFAGSITYVSTGFVEKNTDKLPNDAVRLLAASTNPLVAALFASSAAGGGGGGGGGGGRRNKGASQTVSGVFGESLKELIKQLKATSSYFVRCVRPRGGVHAAAERKVLLAKQASKSRANLLAEQEDEEDSLLHGVVVLPQLEASGVLEAVNLMTLGFPTRIPYEQIHLKYGSALPEWATSLSPRELCEAIAMASGMPSTDVAYGLTSLFCRAGKAAFLERLLGGADGTLDDPGLLEGLHELLETFERKRQVMPIVKKNLQMWVHRRRYLAYKEAKKNAKSRLKKGLEKAGKAEHRRRHVLMQLQRSLWEGARNDKAEKNDAATKIQAAFNQRRDRLHEAKTEAEERQQRLTSLFRAAARASVAFAGHAVRLRQAASEKQDGVFGGALLHAGYLQITHLDGRSMAPVLVPPGEYYCVLLSSHYLLCFEADSEEPFRFDATTGEAVGCRPIALEHGATVRIGRSQPQQPQQPYHAATSFELTVSGPQTTNADDVPCTWSATPSLFDEDDVKSIAHGVQVWIQRLSLALVPDGTRASRASLARTTSFLSRADEDDEDDEDDESKSATKAAPAHMAGKWADGCFYRGDGVVAYYAAPCPDDPYA